MENGLGQTGEEGLEPLAQTAKGAQLALLLLRLAIPRCVFEKVTEQRDDQAVGEGQAGPEEVDEGQGCIEDSPESSCGTKKVSRHLACAAQVRARSGLSAG
ncbi:hypothetical protein, partial [Candidatus Accumulibacter vicinus]|uniref:hypothetical protein n=1 Tax=Candidatus Accumulibacter vicinus TaxID=2954382 RepID=UPI00235B5D11